MNGGRGWTAALVLLALALPAPAPAARTRSAPKPVVAFTVSDDSHRVSGLVCEGARACAPVGCATATVSPVTSDTLTPVAQQFECRVDVSVVVAGKVTAAGRPVKGAFVVVQAQNTDTDKCWPDTSIAKVVACSGTVSRATRGTGGATAADGSFSFKLLPDTYLASSIKMPLDQVIVCKQITVRVTVKVGATKTARTTTLNACA